MFLSIIPLFPKQKQYIDFWLYRKNRTMEKIVCLRLNLILIIDYIPQIIMYDSWQKLSSNIVVKI